MTGQYELKDVVMGEDVIGEKRFYTMTYTTLKDKIEQRAALYLYFPMEQGVTNFLVALYSETSPIYGDKGKSSIDDFIECLNSLEMTQ